MYFDGRRLSLVALAFLALVAGCSDAILPKPEALPLTTTGGEPREGSDDLKRQIDEALADTYHRRLDTKVNAAWQIIHGCIAYKQDLLIHHEGRDLRAIEYLFGGGAVEGWEFEPGVMLPTGRRGLRAIPRPGSTRGQGHDDQWLGYLSGCQMPLDTTLIVGGETYTLADYLGQIEHDVYRNALREYSWTLMALATYRDYDYRWTAGDGKEWSIAKLVEIELEHDVNASPCGGSHRMVGVTMALNKCKAQGGRIEGVWQRAHDRVLDLVATAEEYQNADGSLSSNFFARPGKSVDLAAALGSAGHVLEFLMVALDDEEIKQPWITRAVAAQCRMFRATKQVDVECGGLYHSASGLRIYRERMYGPCEFGPVSSAATTAPTAPQTR
jgi:hypothetical protein